jgi:tRNA-dihydrouridine synthase B
VINLSSPFGLAPMAGMTDTAFRRLVKRQGGCGLVVTEMVSSEGLVRGIDRTLEYAEFTEEERPVAVQIFGGDPAKMAHAAQVVEKIGADVVDVNMGCPVPKVAKHNAGCSLMREPQHAADIVRAMARAVSIPVTVKMRAGWNDQEVNAPELARRLEAAGAAAIAVHGRTAAQSYTGRSDWELIARVARAVSIPVFGNGDCVEPAELVQRLNETGVAGVLVGRGVLRNPWIFAQATASANGQPILEVSLADRGRFLLEYIDLLLSERVHEATGFRHSAESWMEGAVLARSFPSRGDGGLQDSESDEQIAEMLTGPRRADSPSASNEARPTARGRERWVVNKVRALCAWYTRGLEGGSHLRVAVNHTDTIPNLRRTISDFFFTDAAVGPRTNPSA